MKKVNTATIGFKYIYVDGDRVRVRIPGQQSKSFTVPQYGSYQRTFEAAVVYRNMAISLK